MLCMFIVFSGCSNLLTTALVPDFEVLKCPWSRKLAPSILKETLKLEKQPAGCVNDTLVDFGSVGQHPSRVLGGVSYLGMCQLSHNG